MKQANTYSAMLDEATSRRAELNGQDMGQGRKRVIRAALRCIRLRAAPAHAQFCYRRLYASALGGGCLRAAIWLAAPSRRRHPEAR